MNDDMRLERLYGDALHSLAPARAPDRLRTRIHAETERAAPRPRWLALIKEPPMRISSHLAVGSPTWRAAAFVAATILVAALVIGASFAGAQLVAKGGFIVDASGDGTHTSIAAAVADADEGYEIFVRPGTYEEAFTLDKTVSITGDGPVDEIVLTAPADGPTAEYSVSDVPDPYAIHITGGEPTIKGLTLRGTPSELIVSGGTATLEGLVVEDVGKAFDGVNVSFGGSSILADGPDTHLIIRDSEVLRGGPIVTVSEAVAIIEDNTLAGGPHLFLHGLNAGSTVIGNDISGTRQYALNIHDTTGTEVTGNTFSDSGDSAIRVRNGGSGRIADNVINGDSTNGIRVDDAHGLQVVGNTVSGQRQGITWQGDAGRLEGNDVTDSERGFVIDAGSPVVVGNSACGNTHMDLVVGGGASPDLGENEFCTEYLPSA